MKRTSPLAAAAAALVPALFALAACSAGSKPSNAPGAGSGEQAPKVIVEDSTETWYEEASGKPGEKGTGVREYVLDVTKRVEWKNGGGTLLDAGAPPPDKNYRIAVRFPVPKVMPEGARDVHTINRLLWEVRKEIAKCYYKGPGKDPGEELAMIGWLTVDKAGEITGGGVEKADEPMQKSPGFTDCVIENVKGLAFSPAGDDTKIRFKLKMQTLDVTGQPGVKTSEPPPGD